MNKEYCTISDSDIPSGSGGIFIEIGMAKNKRLTALKPKTAFPKLETSAKSVQTSAEVCADYTCSLYRLQLKSPESTTYLQI